MLTNVDVQKRVGTLKIVKSGRSPMFAIGTPEMFGQNTDRNTETNCSECFGHSSDSRRRRLPAPTVQNNGEEVRKHGMKKLLGLVVLAVSAIAADGQMINHAQAESCRTDATQFATCKTEVVWRGEPGLFPDSSYTVACSITGSAKVHITGKPMVFNIEKHWNLVTVTIVNFGNDPAAGELDCIAMNGFGHDLGHPHYLGYKGKQ